MQLQQYVTNIVKAVSGNKPTEPNIDEPYSHFGTRQQRGIQLPEEPHNVQYLYRMADMEAILRTVIKAISNQVFKKKIVIKPLFWGRCKECKHEVEQKPADAHKLKEKEYRKNGYECPECDDGKVFPPDKMQYELMKSFFKKANNKGNSLIKEARKGEDDLNIADNLYFIFKKAYDYSIDNDGGFHIEGWEPVEIIHAHAGMMKPSANKRGKLGTVDYTCLLHREWWTQEKNGICEHCGNTNLEPVYYFSTKTIGSDVDRAFIKDEVYHTTKFKKDDLFGFSMIHTLWPYCLTLLRTIEAAEEYFEHREYPNGLFLIPTKDKKELKLLKEDWEEKTKQRKHYRGFFAFDPQTQAKPEYVSFFDNFVNSQLLEIRDEARDRVGAAYGVEPIFQGDLTGGGGLNNEGLQITVTLDVVESDQAIWNDEVFLAMRNFLRVTDWTYEFPNPKEEDRMAILDEELRKAEVIEKWTSLGYDAQRDSQGGIIISESPKEKKPGEEDNQQDEKDQDLNQEVNESRTYDEYQKKREEAIEKQASVNDVLASNVYTKISQDLQDIFNGEIEGLKRTKKEDQITEGDYSEILTRFKQKSVDTINNWLKKYFSVLFSYGEQSVVNPDSDDLVHIENITLDSLLGGNELDREVIESFVESRMAQSVRAIKTFTDEIAEKLMAEIKDTFVEAKHTPSLDVLIANLQNHVVTETFKLERIARSESQKFVLAGREKGYRELQQRRRDQGEAEELLYIWSIRRDDRTSKHCQEIARRVKLSAQQQRKRGLSIDELKMIVDSVAREYNGKKWQITDWLPHPSCRSKFIRIV